MTGSDLLVFSSRTADFFETMTGRRARVEAPVPEHSSPVALEFSAVIGITGCCRGVVYLTMSEEMTAQIYRDMGYHDPVQNAGMDLVGEILNTICGNAREEMGREFEISVPVAVSGRQSLVRFSCEDSIYSAAITWCGHRGYIYICLEPVNRDDDGPESFG